MNPLVPSVLALLVLVGHARAASSFAEPLFGKQSHYSRGIDEEHFGAEKGAGSSLPGPRRSPSDDPKSEVIWSFR
jgi:hypothetical protein